MEAVRRSGLPVLWATVILAGVLCAPSPCFASDPRPAGPVPAADCTDADGDGYADCSSGCDPVLLTCGDCDDSNAAIHPGALEVCNGVDDNCNDQVDENLNFIRCGLGACSRLVYSCANGQPQECVPGTPSPEVCNGADDDCDGEPDNGLVQSCSTACGTGISPCGNWPGCTAAPCCDCRVGAGQTYADICGAVAAGCHNLCVGEGQYAAPQCLVAGALVATGNRDATVINGALLNAFMGTGSRVQGFTILGDVSSNNGITLIGNRIVGRVRVGCAPLGMAGQGVVEFNDVTSGLGVCVTGTIWGNTVGGTLDARSQGSTLILGNEVTGTGAGDCIRMGVQASAYENHVRGCANGINGGTSDISNVAWNEVTDCTNGITVTDSTGPRPQIVSNRVVGSLGTAISVFGIEEEGSQIVGNLVDGGGYPDFGQARGNGIVTKGSAVVSENTIVGVGTALQSQRAIGNPDARIDLRSNIIVFARDVGVTLGSGVHLVAKNNDVFGGGVNWVGVADPTGVDGNLSADPGFTSPADGDWTLSPGSVCIDRGLSSNRPLDLDGGPRVLDGDMDGLAIQDIGAFEAAPIVAGLGLDGDPEMLHWDANPYATNGYDVYRGLASEMRTSGLFVTHPLACGDAATAWSVAGDAVPLGDAFVYAVAPHGAVSGSLGVDSAGHERPLTDPCP
jgi:hypothetical protein